MSIQTFIQQTEIETHKTELAREIATLKKCLADARGADLTTLRAERDLLQAKLQQLQQQQQQQHQQQQQQQHSAQPDERDQAVSRMKYFDVHFDVDLNGVDCVWFLI